MIFEWLISYIKKFSKAFWFSNVLELFERFAFYGSKSILVIFLANKVGLGEDAGKLAGLFTSIIFGLTILAGVFVDKYGLRRTLIFCFSIFCIGYFIIAMAGMSWSQPIIQVFGVKTYITLALVFTATGGSLIKPCIVGTVALNTNKENRAQGFSIYYSMVNLGGAIGPALALLTRQELGIEFVLVMSSITSFFLMLATILFFKEPAPDKGIADNRTLGKVFAEMVQVFKNFRFILFLVIFSGFWIMFWQVFYLLPFYATEVLAFKSFEILESVDAWFIIFFSIFLTSIFKNWKPIFAMIVGSAIASLSWTIIALFGTVWSVVIGVGIFAIGESIQASRFYEYITDFAPSNQLGTYMGFAFFPIAIGSFSAGYVADYLRLNFLETQPYMMWNILFFIGIATTVLLILFDQIFVKTKSKIL